jgi:hypothetical protein
VNDNGYAKTKRALPLLNSPNVSIKLYINNRLRHICFGFKILNSGLRNFQIIPKHTHNSTTEIRVVRRHAYVHVQHVVVVFIHMLIHSHVTQCESSPFFICLFVMVLWCP